MISAVWAVVALATTTPVVSSPSADTLKGVKHVEFLLYRDYYKYPNGMVGKPNKELDALMWRATPGSLGLGGKGAFACEADDDQVCNGGDLDKGKCSQPDSYCHADPTHFLKVVTEEAEKYPASGYLLGQAVYAMVKYKTPLRAMELVQRCQAAQWWCDALHGYVFGNTGAMDDADPFLERAMAEAPDSVSCAYTDATWLMGEWDARLSPFDPPAAWRRADSWNCRRRRAVSDTIWWLADPLYSVAGNDRWAAHVVRSLMARFQREIKDQAPWTYERVRHDTTRWAATMRRGPWDSFDEFGAEYTGEEAARYHFVPNVDLDSLSSPEWDIEGHLNLEGYTPPGRPFVEIPAQVARFRWGDSIWVAVAATLGDVAVEPDPDSASWLIFTDGPGSFPLRLKGHVDEDRSVFIGQVARRTHVLSLEIHGDSSIAWHRQALEPLDNGEAGLSDLLLYRPVGSTEPDSLHLAAGLMLGSTTVEGDDDVGVYWETYGVPTDTAKAKISFTLTLAPAPGGVGALLGRLVPGGGQERGRVAWVESGTPGTHRKAVALDLSDVDPGEYTLILRAEWPGQPPLERRLDVTIE